MSIEDRSRPGESGSSDDQAAKLDKASLTGKAFPEYCIVLHRSEPGRKNWVYLTLEGYLKARRRTDHESRNRDLSPTRVVICKLVPIGEVDVDGGELP